MTALEAWWSSVGSHTPEHAAKGRAVALCGVDTTHTTPNRLRPIAGDSPATNPGHLPAGERPSPAQHNTDSLSVMGVRLGRALSKPTPALNPNSIRPASDRKAGYPMPTPHRIERAIDASMTAIAVLDDAIRRPDLDADLRHQLAVAASHLRVSNRSLSGLSARAT